MAESKTQPTKLSVADFLKKKASAAQLADCKELVKLLRDLTGKSPKMWGPSIVGFDSYHYVYDSGREGDAPLTGFSPRGKEIVLYVNTAPSKSLLKKLGKHRAGAGCLYIKSLAEVDPAVLRELAQNSIDEIRARYPAKPAR
jgi:Domain of unknown function (DU1801)